MKKVFRKRLNVFIAGPQTSAQGIEREFSRDDLQEVVDSYDPSVHEAPLVIGHAGDHDGAPSYGWIKSFSREGDKLYADVEFTDAAKDLVRKKHYKKVSISFYSPESPINPHKGQWSARHLALLGASPPAVKGLEPFSFSEGVFDYATAFSPEDIFDKDLGPTLIADKNPLEMLRERLDEIQGDIKDSLEELEQNQENQTEADVSEGAQEETPEKADAAAPENPNQQFSEMKKKMGREGSEVTDSAQEMETMDKDKLDNKFEEGTKRRKAQGAHGQDVQVVQEVFEEDEAEEDSDKEFAEGVGHKKVSKDGVTFGKHPETEEDPAGRGKTGKSSDDSYGSRQKVGKDAGDGREDQESDDGGYQDMDRSETSSDGEQDMDRERMASSTGDGDQESRWADQPEAKKMVENGDQTDNPYVAPASTGNEPAGRDGGPTEVPDVYEEEPSDEDIAVPLESTKGNKKARVIHTKSGDERSPVKGGSIADHAEGEEDGLTDEPVKGKRTDPSNPHGRAGSKTQLPTKSEEEPDDLEMAVDLEDAVESNLVRIIRQMAGDQASIDHGEKSKSSHTKTGKGSTYGKEQAEFEDEEDDEDDDYEMGDMGDFGELDEGTEDFCGMGSMGQSKAMGFPSAMYEELRALKEENDRLKREYEEHRIKTRKAKIAEFIDNLYVEGKLTDGVIPQRELQSYCEGLEFGTLEFSEGETPTTKLFSLLNKLPNMVHYGEVVSNAEFKEPDEEEMDPHARAMRMLERGEAKDYVEAIKLCIPWGTR